MEARLVAGHLALSFASWINYAIGLGMALGGLFAYNRVCAIAWSKPKCV